MKKILTLLIISVYAIAAIGAPLTFHYCMGQLVNCTLINSQSGICSKCGMEKHPDHEKDCCKDISLLVKTSHSHLLIPVNVEVNGQYTGISENLYFQYRYVTDVQLNIYSKKSADPPRQNLSLFICNRNFRI